MDRELFKIKTMDKIQKFMTSLFLLAIIVFILSIIMLFKTEPSSSTFEAVVDVTYGSAILMCVPIVYSSIFPFKQ